MPAPAFVSTITLWPWWTSSRTEDGTRPTRYSWFLISFGTPTSMMRCPSPVVWPVRFWFAGGPVVLSVEAEAGAVVRRHLHRVAVVDQRAHRGRHQADAVLVVLDLLRHADQHDALSLPCCLACSFLVRGRPNPLRQHARRSSGLFPVPVLQVD